MVGRRAVRSLGGGGCPHGDQERGEGADEGDSAEDAGDRVWGAQPELVGQQAPGQRSE